jgi:bifunctional N-acetylglucosamine-1-phosphate-uridyltransferase/glucosamine-1-phosphate-acetyltransferase GlmU-like protein
MAIALVGLVVVMGSLATLGRIAVRQASRVHSIVEQRNADAQDQAVFFQGK